MSVSQVGPAKATSDQKGMSKTKLQNGLRVEFRASFLLFINYLMIAEDINFRRGFSPDPFGPSRC
jgi:hypothetical protein